MKQNSKQIPVALVRDYVKACARYNKAKAEMEGIKVELRDYFKKGYMHPLLNCIPKMVFKPDWKKLCLELIKSYLTPDERKTWWRKVHRRYPKKPIEAAISINKNAAVEELLK